MPESLRYHAEVVSHHYLLEPGDGTRYTFSITRCDGLRHILPGVSRTHVLIGLSNRYPSFVIQEAEALEPKKYMLPYVRGQTNAPTYTIAAVLLAASALLEDPEALAEACVRMLRARELLS
jgi:hypothetical protein